MVRYRINYNEVLKWMEILYCYEFSSGEFYKEWSNLISLVVISLLRSYIECLSFYNMLGLLK